MAYYCYSVKIPLRLYTDVFYFHTTHRRVCKWDNTCFYNIILYNLYTINKYIHYEYLYNNIPGLVYIYNIYIHNTLAK